MANFRWQKNLFGFTIIEVVVALAIFSVGILGIVPLFTQSIKFSASTRSQLIASMLAQEGLEMARNARDNEWLKAGGGDFTNCFASGFTSGDKYFVFKRGGAKTDLNVSGITDAFNSNDSKIKNYGMYYDHDSTETNPAFKRVIKITATTASYYTIESTVRWTDRGASHDYTASTELYNWR